MRNYLLLCATFLTVASLAKADLVPILCQNAGSACGATPAFTMLGANSYVYNYSIDLSAVEQINTALGASSVTLSGFTGVTSATAAAGWTVGSTTSTSVTFNATSADDGVGQKDFGIFMIDTSVGGATTDTGSYSSSAWKLNGLADAAQGGLTVNAAGSVVPEPTSRLLVGLALAGIGIIGRRSRLARG